jgi:hypothetical protein
MERDEWLRAAWRISDHLVYEYQAPQIDLRSERNTSLSALRA